MLLFGKNIVEKKIKFKQHGRKRVHKLKTKKIR